MSPNSEKIRNIKELIKDVNKQLEPLVRNKNELARALRKEESIEFIYINKIKKNEVQRADDKDIPWMGHIDVFGKWLKDNSYKPWCCWNGCLYRTSEIIAGNMARNAPGHYADLKEDLL